MLTFSGTYEHHNYQAIKFYFQVLVSIIIIEQSNSLVFEVTYPIILHNTGNSVKYNVTKTSFLNITTFV